MDEKELEERISFIRNDIQMLMDEIWEHHGGMPDGDLPSSLQELMEVTYLSGGNSGLFCAAEALPVNRTSTAAPGFWDEHTGPEWELERRYDGLSSFARALLPLDVQRAIDDEGKARRANASPEARAALAELLKAPE